MAHGCGLTSVRGNRGENYEKGTAGSPKTYKEKKSMLCEIYGEHGPDKGMNATDPSKNFEEN
jgi:hypothetical protein